ncbi:hypothetical protein ACNKHS_16370 [Shigella flexneri]
MLVEQKIAALSTVEISIVAWCPMQEQMGTAGNRHAFSVEGDSEWRGLG